MQDQRIEMFVDRLWKHARLRSFGPGGEGLNESAKKVKFALSGINPFLERQQIGEELTAHVLNFAVMRYARPSCETCQRISDCINMDNGPCEKYEKDPDAFTANLVLLYDAIFSLDGAYGFDGGKMVAVISSFLDQLD